MAEARERSEWNRASVLIAKLHNVNVTKRGDCIDFRDVHPHYILKRSGAREPTREDLVRLKSLIQGM